MAMDGKTKKTLDKPLSIGYNIHMKTIITLLLAVIFKDVIALALGIVASGLLMVASLISSLPNIL